MGRFQLEKSKMGLQEKEVSLAMENSSNKRQNLATTVLPPLSESSQIDEPFAI